MKQFLNIFLVLFIFSLSAQQIDEISFENFSDTNDIKKMLCLSRNISIEKPYKSIEIGKNALKLSKQLNYLPGQAESYSILADCFNILDDYKMALFYNNEALKIYEKLNDKQKIASLYQKAGSILSSSGLLDEAKVEFGKALDVFYSINDISNIAKITGNIKMIWKLKQVGINKSIKYYLNNLLCLSPEYDTTYYKLYGYAGTILYHLGNVDKAVLLYAKGIENAQKYNVTKIIPEYLLRLGIIYKEKQNYDKAAYFLVKALNYYKKNEDSTGIVISDYNLGKIYELNGDYHRAQNYYLRGSNIAENNNINKTAAELLLSIGDINIKTGNIKKAEEYYLRGKNIADKIDNKDILALALMKLGDVKQLQNQNEIAEKYYILCMHEADFAKNIYISKDIRKKLSSLAANSGNYKKAYEYQKEYYKMKDSIASIESNKLFSNLETRYIIESKENQINILKKDNEINTLTIKTQRTIRFFLIAVIILFAALLVLLVNRLMFIRKVNFLLTQQKNEIISKNAELTKLNSELESQKKRVELLNQDLLESNIKLKKSEENLIESNKAKDKFFSIISHDLRSPFATIISFANLLSKDLDKFSREELSEMVEEFSRSVEQINNLLENLLQWSRSQTGKIKNNAEILKFNDIVDDTLSLFTSLLKEKNLTVNKDIDKDLVVWADRNMTYTILRNLISNAIKYSYPGQQISIITKKQGDFVEIQVVDQGIGISEENQKKLFHLESTQSTFGTNYEKGSGLGLVLCKEFVEKLGGDIRVVSKENHGSTFIFTLPAAIM